MRRYAVSLWLLSATSCAGDLAQARIVADASSRTVTASAPLLHTYCTVPAEAALAQVRAMPEGYDRQEAAFRARKMLEARQCPRLANAYEGAALAAITLDAVVVAAETGQCVGVSRSVAQCNVAGAMVKASTAVSQLVAALERAKGLR